MSITVKKRPEKEISGVIPFKSLLNSVSTPVVYELRSNKFPINTSDVLLEGSFISYNQARRGTSFNTAVNPAETFNVLDSIYITNSGIELLDNKFHRIKLIEDRGDGSQAIYLDVNIGIFQFAESFNYIKHYDDYRAKVKISTGFPAGHYQCDINGKCMEEVEEVEVFFKEQNGENIGYLNLSEALAEKLNSDFDYNHLTVNDSGVTSESASNPNLSRFASISFAESYTSSNGVSFEEYTSIYVSDFIEGTGGLSWLNPEIENFGANWFAKGFGWFPVNPSASTYSFEEDFVRLSFNPTELSSSGSYLIGQKLTNEVDRTLPLKIVISLDVSVLPSGFVPSLAVVGRYSSANGSLYQRLASEDIVSEGVQTFIFEPNSNFPYGFEELGLQIAEYQGVDQTEPYQIDILSFEITTSEGLSNTEFESEEYGLKFNALDSQSVEVVTDYAPTMLHDLELEAVFEVTEEDVVNAVGGYQPVLFSIGDSSSYRYELVLNTNFNFIVNVVVNGINYGQGFVLNSGFDLGLNKLTTLNGVNTMTNLSTGLASSYSAMTNADISNLNFDKVFIGKTEARANPSYFNGRFNFLKLGKEVFNFTEGTGLFSSGSLGSICELSSAAIWSPLVTGNQTEEGLRLNSELEQYLSIPQTEKVYSVPATGLFRFGVKIKVAPTVESRNKGLIGYDPSTSSSTFGSRFALYINSGGTLVLSNTNNASFGVVTLNNFEQNYAGQIVEIVGEYFTGGLRILINGNSEATSGSSVRPSTINSNIPFRIGVRGDSDGTGTTTNSFFNGEIYSAFVGKDYFEMNEGSGLNIKSLSGTTAFGSSLSDLDNWNKNTWLKTFDWSQYSTASTHLNNWHKGEGFIRTFKQVGKNGNTGESPTVFQNTGFNDYSFYEAKVSYEVTGIQPYYLFKIMILGSRTEDIADAEVISEQFPDRNGRFEMSSDFGTGYKVFGLKVSTSGDYDYEVKVFKAELSNPSLNYDLNLIQGVFATNQFQDPLGNNLGRNILRPISEASPEAIPNALTDFEEFRVLEYYPNYFNAIISKELIEDSSEVCILANVYGANGQEIATGLKLCSLPIELSSGIYTTKVSVSKVLEEVHSLPFSDWSFIDWYYYNGEEAISSTKRARKTSYCRNEGHVLRWLTSSGAWENFYFNNFAKKEVVTKAAQYLIKDTYNSMTGNFEKGDTVEELSSMMVNDSITLYSDWITEAELVTLQGIRSSIKVMISTGVEGKFQTVKLNQGSFVTFDNEKRNREVSFKVSLPPKIIQNL